MNISALKNSKLHLDQNTFQIVYNRNKHNLIPLGIILACVFLILVVIVPQVQQIIEQKKEEELQRSENELLTQNIEFLSALDSNELDSQFEIARITLPGEADYAGIITSVVESAVVSDVKLGDFFFGPIASASADDDTKPAPAASDTSTPVNIVFGGDLKAANEFLKSLAVRFPLSEVRTLEHSGKDQGDVDISFYYKPYIPVRDTTPKRMEPLTKEQIELVEKLNQWKRDALGVSGLVPSSITATISAVPTVAVTPSPSVRPSPTPRISPTPTP